MKKKILLVQLVSNGDCVMVTALAKQIKHDYPGCDLTWAISYKCKQVIENNPFVDSIWEINYKESESLFEGVWLKLKEEINEKIKQGFFHKVFFTQIYPDNIYKFDGTTRSSTFRSYPKKITVPVTPVLRLFDSEIESVKTFAMHHKLTEYKHVVLVECAANSGQSFFNQEKANSIAQYLISSRQDLLVIISSHLKIDTPSERIIDASQLTYRENAELSKYCTLLVGCSSGITWLLTSDWAKKLPTVQFLSTDKTGFQFASVKYDFDYWHLDSSKIIESSQQDSKIASNIVIEAINDFDTAKALYHEEFKPSLISLQQNISLRHFSKTIRTIYYFISRNNSKISNSIRIVGFIFKILFLKIKNKVADPSY